MLEALDAHERGRLRGCLLGTAVGDALGLPYEGMTSREIAARCDPFDAYRLLGRIGFVSDDTEQTALVLASVIESEGDPERARVAFRKALLAWCARLPFGVGLATLRASGRILTGRTESGVCSAGNGAAMRSSVLGACFPDDGARRRALARALARVTHTDARAVEGAVYAAELTALCVRAQHEDRAQLALAALRAVDHPSLSEAIEGAVTQALIKDTCTIEQRGYVVDTLRLCVFAFVRHGRCPLEAMRAVIARGGDTDTASAIVGGWLGALHGEAALPRALIEALQDGPFGPSHLAALADAFGEREPPRYTARCTAT